jgi:uridine phosphorylase
MKIPASELILNSDLSVYHLNLLPQDIADNIIFVGDPDRVGDISCYFDTIEVKKQKREFLTHTGTMKGKRITVISTGIGTDNIDIVINELDALLNVDLEKREVKKELKSLKIIRIGTSGALHADIPLDSIVLSQYAIGMEGLMHFYQTSPSPKEMQLKQDFEAFLKQESIAVIEPYTAEASQELLDLFPEFVKGITLTNTGFYAPQGRQVRAIPKVENYNDKMSKFHSSLGKITNFEMETSGIYGLSNLLGHHALSVNVIIANRALGKFSENPQQAVKKAIEMILGKL